MVLGLYLFADIAADGAPRRARPLQTAPPAATPPARYRPPPVTPAATSYLEGRAELGLPRWRPCPSASRRPCAAAVVSGSGKS